MTFDWFTFAAQLINFVLLIYLLQRFLYGPITKLMDERQATIKAQVKEAKIREQNAELTLGSYQEEKSRLEAEREELLAQARLEAEKLKQGLLKDARAEVAVERQKWQEALAKEKEDFLQSLQKRVTKELFQAMRHALAELANVDLEQHIISVFIKRLANLQEDERKLMQQAFAQTKQQAHLYTAFALSDSQLHALEQALIKALDQEVTLNLELRPELICGLELTVRDQRLAWTLASYLESLEKELSQQLSSNEVSNRLAVGVT